jgi:hypothetical protein
MKSRMYRTVLAVAVVAGAVVGVAPSDAAGGWVVIGRGEIPGTGAAALDLVHAGVGFATNAAKDRACTPKARSVTAGDLSWTLWRNQSTGAVAFEWHGPGSASVSDECAHGLTLLVKVTDYGSSGAEEGSPGSASDSTAGDGAYSAYSEAHNWVVYYDPSRLYQRGNSVVEIKVTATYYNKKARAWLPLGCTMTHTAITPWPTGPSGTTAPPESCG